MKKQNAPTMKDVAREAGVALGTVSKVINGIPVREEYRKKVEDAIAKLDYEVNTYARGSLRYYGDSHLPNYWQDSLITSAFP